MGRREFGWRGLDCWGGGRGKAAEGGLEGEVAQVQLSFVGKYGIAFSGQRASKASLLRMKAGQVCEELGCDELSPHETHLGVLLQSFEQ